MSLCTKIMQVYCCFVFLFFLSVCSPLGLFFQRHQILFLKIIFSPICTVHINGNLLSNSKTFHLWLNLLSYSPNGDPGVLLYFRSWRYIFGWQSLIDDCSYETKSQTIFSFQVIHVIGTFSVISCFLFVCYFQHLLS